VALAYAAVASYYGTSERRGGECSDASFQPLDRTTLGFAEDRTVRDEKNHPPRAPDEHPLVWAFSLAYLLEELCPCRRA